MLRYILLVVCFGSFAFSKERRCSAFHYEEQLLEKMIRSEIKMEDMKRTISEIELRMNDTLEKTMEAIGTKIQQADDFIIKAEHSTNKTLLDIDNEMKMAKQEVKDAIKALDEIVGEIFKKLIFPYF